MFHTKELTMLNKDYFNIIQQSVHCVTLQSKNTGHYWHIIHQEYSTFKSCIIYHNHTSGAAYHVHGCAPTLADAVSRITSHDIFQLNGRKKQKRKHLSFPHTTI